MKQKTLLVDPLLFDGAGNGKGESSFHVLIVAQGKGKNGSVRCISRDVRVIERHIVNFKRMLLGYILHDADAALDHEIAELDHGTDGRNSAFMPEP